MLTSHPVKKQAATKRLLGGAAIRCVVARALLCQQQCSTASVKALVRWATGERLTNRLPKLSLITLSPPLNSGILGLRMGLYVPTPMFFYNLWGPRESDSSDS